MYENEDYAGQEQGLYQQGGIDYSTPPDFNYQRLKGLGFSVVEIQTCEKLFKQGAKFTTTFLQQFCGFDYDTAARLRYLYDVAQGKVEIETDDELCKHLKKMFGHRRKITLADVPTSNIREVPKLCVIGDVTDTLFYCYNSVLYKASQRFYRVLTENSKVTVIRTQRKPEIKFRGTKETAGVAKILTEVPNPDGSIEVEFNAKYTCMCNRYIILVSTKRPEFHLGGYELIVADGSKFYVFGRLLPAKSDLKYKATQERVLDCGVIASEINTRITNAAKLMHKKLAGVKANVLEATSTFELLYNPAADYDIDKGAENSEDIALSAENMGI